MLTNVASRLIPTGEAAEAIGVSPATLLRWVKQGKIKPTDETLGGHYRWDLDDLRRQMDERKAQGKRSVST